MLTQDLVKNENSGPYEDPKPKKSRDPEPCKEGLGLRILLERTQVPGSFANPGLCAENLGIKQKFLIF